MNVIEVTGIVRKVTDAVNFAYSNALGGVNRLPIVGRVELTRAEMDEFIANNPFKGRVGKFSGDDYPSSLLNIEYSLSDNRVLSFILEGIQFTVVE